MRTFTEIRLQKPLKLKRNKTKKYSLTEKMIKIDKSEHTCFTVNNKKSGTAQKEEMEANETRTYP